MRRPRIAVSPNNDALDYLEAARTAGADVTLLDAKTDRAGAALANADGLLLTGGGDIDPTLYGEVAHPSVRVVPGERDALDLELAVRAIERDIPVLAICRGLQVLNVALGGTLIQDIPTALPQALAHSVQTPRDGVAHQVHIAPGTRLAALLTPQGGDRLVCGVNSRHHQAVKRLAHSLLVTATAPDGVIEALERPESVFCVAVQWHPENFWRTGEFRSLFEGLVQAAVAR